MKVFRLFFESNLMVHLSLSVEEFLIFHWLRWSWQSLPQTEAVYRQEWLRLWDWFLISVQQKKWVQPMDSRSSSPFRSYHGAKPSSHGARQYQNDWSFLQLPNRCPPALLWQWQCPWL